MNILITGSTGFIGSHITGGLAKSYRLLTPTHRQLDLLDDDRVSKYLKRHPVDVLIHTAVIGGSGPDFTKPDEFRQNIHMFFNLVRSHTYFKKMIFIDSGAVYDKRFPIVSAGENSFGNCIPTDPYGLYKFICSTYIEKFNKIVDLRVFGIFGEGEDLKRFITHATLQCLRGQAITIKQNVIFDYLDAADFVKIVDFFIRHKAKHTSYNVGSGKKIDLVTIARKIQAIHGVKNGKIIIGKRGYANEYTPDIGRLRKEYKTFAPTPPDESLTRLYMWYKGRMGKMSRHEI